MTSLHQPWQPSAGLCFSAIRPNGTVKFWGNALCEMCGGLPEFPFRTEFHGNISKQLLINSKAFFKSKKSRFDKIWSFGSMYLDRSKWSRNMWVARHQVRPASTPGCSTRKRWLPRKMPSQPYAKTDASLHGAWEPSTIWFIGSNTMLKVKSTKMLDQMKCSWTIDYHDPWAHVMIMARFRDLHGFRWMLLSWGCFTGHCWATGGSTGHRDHFKGATRRVVLQENPFGLAPSWPFMNRNCLLTCCDFRGGRWILSHVHHCSSSFIHKKKKKLCNPNPDIVA